MPEEPRRHGKLQGKASQPGSARAAKCTSGGDESLRDTDEQASAMAEHGPGLHVQADLQQMDLAAAPGGRVLVPAVAKSGGGVKAQGAGKARRHKPLSRLQRIEAEVQAKKVRRCSWGMTHQQPVVGWTAIQFWVDDDAPPVRLAPCLRKGNGKAHPVQAAMWLQRTEACKQSFTVTCMSALSLCSRHWRKLRQQRQRGRENSGFLAVQYDVQACLLMLLICRRRRRRRAKRRGGPLRRTRRRWRRRMRSGARRLCCCASARAVGSRSCASASTRCCTSCKPKQGRHEWLGLRLSFL